MGSRRTTGRDRRHDKATPAAARRGLSVSTCPVHLLPGRGRVLRRSGPVGGLSTQKLWPRILLTSGPWPCGDAVGCYLGRAPITDASVAAPMRRLCDAAKAAAAAAWAAWRGPMVPAGHTPSVFTLIIMAPSSRVVAVAERKACGSRLNRNSLTRQAIF